MSLINDALKKTQQARATVQEDGSLNRPPHEGEGNGPTRTTSPWPWIFGIVALLVVSIPVSIWLLTSEDDTPQTLETPLSDLVAQQPLPDPVPTETPVEEPTDDEPEPASEEMDPAASEPEVLEKPKTITANPQIVELLKTINVTGLLLSANPEESKILLDGEVYSVNGIIDHQLGCRIAEIRKNAVVFIDESGVRYTKRF